MKKKMKYAKCVQRNFRGYIEIYKNVIFLYEYNIMSVCRELTSKQQLLYDVLTSKIIENIPCDIKGGKKTKKQRSMKKTKKQRGGMPTNEQVRSFVKRALNIGMITLIVYSIAIGPWQNIFKELQEGYELWTSGNCRSWGNRFYGAFNMGNRFCQIANKVDSDLWGLLLNTATSRDTILASVASIVGTVGAITSYNALANTIADQIASVVGSRPDVPAITNNLDVDTRRQVDEIANRIQEQLSTSVDQAVERILSKPELYQKIATKIQENLATEPYTSRGYDVEDNYSQETISPIGSPFREEEEETDRMGLLTQVAEKYLRGGRKTGKKRRKSKKNTRKRRKIRMR